MAVRRLLKRREQGAIAIMVTILLGSGVLLGVAALVVDVGNLYAERGQLQSGADASAMAVAAECETGTCDNFQDPDLQTMLMPVAKKYANANAKDGHTKVTWICGRWGNLRSCPAQASGLAACIGTPPAEDYIEIRVQTEMSDGSTLLPPTFATAMAGKSGYRGQSLATCARVTVSSLSTSCVTAANETYHHTFHGDGPVATATITAEKALCPGQTQPVTLVAYTAPDPNKYKPGQYVFDTESKTITPTHLSLSFQVDVPECYNQVDFVFRDKPINPLDGGEVYGNDKIGSSGPPGNRSIGDPGWSHGGGYICDPRPSASLTSMCDGTMQLKLGNGSGANVDAVLQITAGGKDQFVRVAAGATKTVTIAAADAANVSVFDNDNKTKTASWSKPGGC
jgi:predicted HD phosphohydrolase